MIGDVADEGTEVSGCGTVGVVVAAVIMASGVGVALVSGAVGMWLCCCSESVMRQWCECWGSLSLQSNPSIICN